MMRSAIVATGVLLLGMLFRLPAAATEAAAAATASTDAYSGDFFHRSTFTGDWGNGRRNELATKGFTVNATVTQITQGVVEGGKNGAWQYGGRGDLTITLDTQKLGLWPGGFLTAEVEGNWENSVNPLVGALSPPNESQLFPVPGGNNVALPNLSFAQFVSRYAGVTFGKVQTLTGADANEFASGKGDTQFLNLAFNANPCVLVVPYSTLAAGAIILPTADPEQAIVSASVLSATGKATSAGFDDINGAIFAGQGRVRTHFFGLTGHQLLGAVYSNKSYTSIDQRLGFVIENRELARTDDYWGMYYNFDQYLYETDATKGRGLGLFGRFGASKGNPDPAEYFFSIGAGAKGVIPTREFDQFGIGYYYIIIENPTLRVPLTTKRFLRDEWAVEAYYNIALTPWLVLTPDIQVIGPAQKQRIVGGLLDREYIDTAVVLGARLQVIL